VQHTIIDDEEHGYVLKMKLESPKIENSNGDATTHTLKRETQQSRERQQSKQSKRR